MKKDVIQAMHVIPLQSDKTAVYSFSAHNADKSSLQTQNTTLPRQSGQTAEFAAVLSQSMDASSMPMPEQPVQLAPGVIWKDGLLWQQLNTDSEVSAIAQSASGIQQASLPYNSGVTAAKEHTTGTSVSYDGLIQAAAQRYGVPADLIKAVIDTESSFNPQAVSSAGAKGLMQLMDATARGLGVQDSFDPAQNIDGGTKYLAYQLDRFNGETGMALAAYNAGPGRVSRLGITSDEELLNRLELLPAETQSYIYKVLQSRTKYEVS
ncbi:lytic transglycosylase domain-containing protein [Paenibacillus sp. JSM ZJ436]